MSDIEFQVHFKKIAIAHCSIILENEFQGSFAHLACIEGQAKVFLSVAIRIINFFGWYFDGVPFMVNNRIMLEEKQTTEMFITSNLLTLQLSDTDYFLCHTIRMPNNESNTE